MFHPDAGVAEGAKGNFLEELPGMGNIAIKPFKAVKSTYVASGPGFLDQVVNLLMMSSLGVY